MKFKEDEDIEVLDIEDNNKKEDLKVYSRVKKNNYPKATRKKLNKVKLIQFIFCSISALFILGCCVFYGSRLIKYYRIYNPKPSNGSYVALLGNEITSKSEIVYEGSGLYISAGNYIYKGDVSNNYVKYNNMLWRIVRINKDGTIKIILDDHFNILNWDNENVNYLDSNVHRYLNDYYLKLLNKDILAANSVCTDKFNNLSELSCDNKNSDSYVSLLSVSDFLNTIVDEKSYLVDSDEIIWLSDQSDEKVWHTNGYNVSLSESSNYYSLKPTVILKATAKYYNGDGSLENPYIIEESTKKLMVGSYVKLGDDTWVVYNNENNIRLTTSEVIDKQYRFSYESTKYDISDEGSVGNYLNTTFLESLSYQDVLVEDSWYIGTYSGSYKDVLKEEMKAKIGMLNLIDMKIDSEVVNYLLSTADTNGMIYNYGDVLKVGKPTIYRNIRPCISVSKNIKIESGSGTENDPYILEV